MTSRAYKKSWKVRDILRQETWLTSLQSDIQRNVNMDKKKRAMKRHHGRQLQPQDLFSVRALYQAAIGEEQ